MKRRFLRLSGRTLIGALFLALCLAAVTGRADTPRDIFFVCDDDTSPAAFDRSDFIPPCCAGSVEKKALTRSNLMHNLNLLSRALRALSYGRSDELSGPETMQGKADCYVRSVAYISGAMGPFPPKRNADKKSQYMTLLGQLRDRSKTVQQAVALNDKAKSVIAYTEFQNTCGQCHGTFR